MTNPTSNTCRNCSGSGEGYSDGSKCEKCNGSGEELIICPFCEDEVRELYECWVDPHNEYRRQSFVCRDCLNNKPENFAEIL